MENVNNAEKAQKEIQKSTYQTIPFPPISTEELLEILGQTIKKDETNKLIVFLCQISAYTESAQFNTSLNAPSSTGKSYLPLEIASFLPDEDVITIGHCSPTAFFHDKGEYDEERDVNVVDLSRKILIFFDQPQTLLLQYLRPLLSHDKKEIHVKITDRKKAAGHRTKNILLIGYPAVIFCSAGLHLDEQEATRFFLLSPQMSQEKIEQAVLEKLRKEMDSEAYQRCMDDNPERQALKDRIRAIKAEYIHDIKIGPSGVEQIKDVFLKKERKKKPRDTRDVGRLMSLVKSFALLNFWHRECEKTLKRLVVSANNEDVENALKLWSEISQGPELNLPPYLYDLYKDVMLPAFKETQPRGLTRQDVIRKHKEQYGVTISDRRLEKEALPMLEQAGLIIQEPNPNDRRMKLIHPTEDQN